MDDLDRFWQKAAIQPGGCMEWQGPLFTDGYPAFWAQGKTYRGHRWIFEKLVRELRPFEQVLHNCDNRSCVNVFICLRVGTHQDNMDDLVARGNARGIRKSEAWKAKARAVDPEKRRRAALIRWSRRHA